MLKKPCPYHRGPTKHTLEECTLLQRYFSRQNPVQGGDEKGGPEATDGDDNDGFSQVRDCFMIFGGLTAWFSARRCKRERREIFSVDTATPSYLKWSDTAITFDKRDHPDRVSNPGQYPLVVDPIIGYTRLTKVLMDGGSSLNILYVETLRLMGIPLSQLRPGAAPFHGVVPGKRALPLGQNDLPVYFGMPSNFQKETLTFEVVAFRGT